MANTNKYKAAVIGLGRIGMLMEKDPLRTKPATHAGAFYNHPRIERLLLCDIDVKKCEEAETLFPQSTRFTHYDTMLDAMKPDIVAVATHPESHREHVFACAEAGVKVIICEKPIANSIIEAKEMISICREKGATLIIDHPRRFMPLLHHWQVIIQDGDIGTVKQVSCYYTAGIRNSGTHLFDLLRFFFGEISRVMGVYNYDTSAPKDDVNIDGFLFFENGVRASIHSLDVNDYAIFDIDIYSSKGNLKITDFGFSTSFCEVRDCQTFAGYKELDKEIKHSTDESSMWASLADWAICCVDDPSTIPPSTGKDGLKALEIILAMEASANGSGKVIMV